MSQWAEKSEAIKTRLKLRTEPIAFRRLEDAGELESIEGVIRWSEGCVFCQIPYMARVSKLTVAIPCYGERALGQVADDEIVIALPPEELGRVIEGLDTLAKSGFGYPISVIGGFTDPNPFLAQVYPDRKRH